MGAPQFEQAGADISGTGTTNTIPRWTGASTLGDSVITQSGNNIGFGLGANAPISRWHALVPNSGASPTASDWTSSFSATGDYRSGFGFQFSAGTAASNRVACLVSNGTNTGQTVVWTADGAGNVGIGWASPTAKLHVTQGASGSFANLLIGSAGTSTNFYDANEHYWRNGTLATGMYMNASGNVGIGTASPLGYANYVALNIGDNNAAKTGLLKFRSTYNAGNGAELFQATDGRVILNADGTGATSAIFDPTNRLLNIAPASGWGLKLPATPGNADTQTLDCYAEGTWTPTLAGFGGTNPTVTASYTRVGRLVTIAVQFDATGGNQYSMTLGTTTITTPAGMTANSICAAPVVDGGVANRGIASVWTTGIIYLPTVALTTASTFFVATYRV